MNVCPKQNPTLTELCDPVVRLLDYVKTVRNDKKEVAKNCRIECENINPDLKKLTFFVPYKLDIIASHFIFAEYVHKDGASTISYEIGYVHKEPERLVTPLSLPIHRMYYSPVQEVLEFMTEHGQHLAYHCERKNPQLVLFQLELNRKITTETIVFVEKSKVLNIIYEVFKILFLCNQAPPEDFTIGKKLTISVFTTKGKKKFEQYKDESDLDEEKTDAEKYESTTVANLQALSAGKHGNILEQLFPGSNDSEKSGPVVKDTKTGASVKDEPKVEQDKDDFLAVIDQIFGEPKKAKKDEPKVKKTKGEYSDVIDQIFGEPKNAKKDEPKVEQDKDDFLAVIDDILGETKKAKKDEPKVKKTKGEYSDVIDQIFGETKKAKKDEPKVKKTKGEYSALLDELFGESKKDA